MDATSLLETLRARVPEATLTPVPAPDCPTFYVPRENLVEIVRVLRDDAALQFTVVVDITAADYLPRDPRFEVVYQLLRLRGVGTPSSAAARLRLKVAVSVDSASVPTLTGLYPAADWLEREIWDLFGITFPGHPDLRRLLLTDDWEGHPLRKDYPVQVNVPYRSTEAVQVTEQEFLVNVQRQRQATAGGRKPS